MDDKNKYMSIPEYARHRDITEVAIYTALRGGRIARIIEGEHKGKIDYVDADKLWKKNTRRVNKGAESSGEQLSLTAAKIKKEIAVAEREELRTKKMKGDLINRAVVLSRVQTIARQNRDMWLNWPKLVATKMAEEFNADPGLVYDILHDEVRKYLEKVATLDMEDAARSN